MLTFMRTLVLASIFASLLGACAQAQAPSLSQFRSDPARGKALAADLCAGCHAVEPASVSPRTDAPPFSAMLEKYDRQDLVRSLQKGVVMSHPNMPRVFLTEPSARDLVSYLETIRQP
jgi:mono/diheme cytochrome c family protein